MLNRSRTPASLRGTDEKVVVTEGGPITEAVNPSIHLDGNLIEIAEAELNSEDSLPMSCSSDKLSEQTQLKKQIASELDDYTQGRGARLAD